MKNYDVYFELFGKKMKVRMLAENEEKAKEKVMNKIKFHKVVKSNEEFNQFTDMIDELINTLSGKQSDK